MLASMNATKRSPSPVMLLLIRAVGAIQDVFARYNPGGGPVMLEPGQKAPDFEVKDHTGRTVRLSDYKGKDVVLWFYPRADTPG
jgi:hypothetical protein